MKKKLIGFDDELLDKIEVYAGKRGLTFTEAVRNLIEIGISTQDTDTEEQKGDSVDFPSLVNTVVKMQGEHFNLIKQVAKLNKDMAWWNADENTSRTGNLEIKHVEMEKKMNVLTKVSKLFKAHLNDRSIHLQD